MKKKKKYILPSFPFFPNVISLFSTFFRSFFVHFVEFIVRLWFSNRLSLRFQRYRAIPHVHLLIFKPNSLAGALPPEKKRETQLLFLFFSSLPFHFSSAFHQPLRRTRISFIQFRCLFRSNTSLFKSKAPFLFPSCVPRSLARSFEKQDTHDSVLSMFLFLPHDGRTVTPKQKFCIRRGAARSDICFFSCLNVYVL